MAKIGNNDRILMTMGRVILDLHVRVGAERLAAFTSFLQRAVPFYEEPGGIRIYLLQDRAEPTLWIERVEYANTATHEWDQLRVAEDERMRALLAEWRGFLEAPPTVHVYQEVVLNELRHKIFMPARLEDEILR